MRLPALALAALTCACAAAGEAEAWAKVSPEAVARYAAPGDPARYAALAQRLEAPPEALGPPARGLRIPVRSFPDGRPEVLLHAETAWVSADMMRLRGRGVRVEAFDAEGALAETLWAEEAAVDRTAMLAVAKGPIRLERGGDTLTGVGALADLEAQYVKVLRRARIDTARLRGVDMTKRGIF